MASSTEIARRYFAALAAHDLDAAAACWAQGAIDRLVGQQVLVAPDQIKEYFGALFAAFPDFELEVLGTTTYRSRTVVTWRARGTFAGPGCLQGFEPNGARIAIEGCDVVWVSDELISPNDAYLDSGDIARQLGLLPAAGSAAEARLARLANVRTRIVRRVRGTEPLPIAAGGSCSATSTPTTAVRPPASVHPSTAILPRRRRPFRLRPSVTTGTCPSSNHTAGYCSAACSRYGTAARCSWPEPWRRGRRSPALKWSTSPATLPG